MSIKDTLYVLLVVCFMSLVSNILGTKATIVESPRSLDFDRYRIGWYFDGKIFAR